MNINESFFQDIIKAMQFVKFPNEHIKEFIVLSEYFIILMPKEYAVLISWTDSEKTNLKLLEKFYRTLKNNFILMYSILFNFSKFLENIYYQSKNFSLQNFNNEENEQIKKSSHPISEIESIHHKKIDFINKFYSKELTKNKINQLKEFFDKRIENYFSEDTINHFRNQILELVASNNQSKLYAFLINIKNSEKYKNYIQYSVDYFDKDIYGYAGVFPLEQNNGTWANASLNSRYIPPEEYAKRIMDIYSNGYRPSNRELTFNVLKYAKYPNIFFYNDYHDHYGGEICLFRLNLKGKCIFSGSNDGFLNQDHYFESAILTNVSIQKQDLLIILNDVINTKNYYIDIYVNSESNNSSRMHLGDYIKRVEEILVLNKIPFVKEKIISKINRIPTRKLLK